jgi:hypothetical protein
MYDRGLKVINLRLHGSPWSAFHGGHRPGRCRQPGEPGFPPACASAAVTGCNWGCTPSPGGRTQPGVTGRPGIRLAGLTWAPGWDRWAWRRATTPQCQRISMPSVTCRFIRSGPDRGASTARSGLVHLPLRFRRRSIRARRPGGRGRQLCRQWSPGVKRQGFSESPHIPVTKRGRSTHAPWTRAERVPPRGPPGMARGATPGRYFST